MKGIDLEGVGGVEIARFKQLFLGGNNNLKRLLVIVTLALFCSGLAIFAGQNSNSSTTMLPQKMSNGNMSNGNMSNHNMSSGRRRNRWHRKHRRHRRTMTPKNANTE